MVNLDDRYKAHHYNRMHANLSGATFERADLMKMLRPILAAAMIASLLTIGSIPNSADAHNKFVPYRKPAACIAEVRAAKKEKRIAKIQHCSFYTKSLAGRNLSRASGHNAFFSDTNLAGVNFSNANLARAEFGYAMNATGANFYGANLRGVRVSNFSYDEQCLPCFEAANFSYADLRDAYFGSDGMPLQDGKSGQVNLRNANFYGARLSGTSFWAAILTSANLQYVVAPQTDFTNVVFDDVDLQHGTFTGADFDAAVLLSSSNYTFANFTDADFSRAIFASGISFAGAVMTRVILVDQDLIGANLTNVQWNNGNLEWLSLKGADLSGAALQGTRFWGVTLSDTDFRGANLCGAVFGNDEFGETGNDDLLREGATILGDTVMPDCTLYD